MILSQRLWWSVAHNTSPDDAAECMVWAKVRSQCRGKRHYLREIDLTPAEEDAVVRILRNPADDVFRAQIAHEATNFPDGRERCARWFPQASNETAVPEPASIRATDSVLRELVAIRQLLERIDAKVA